MGKGSARRNNQHQQSAPVSIPQYVPIPVPYKGIYENNLKAMRRRKPFLQSYFDNFSHVTVFKRKEDMNWHKIAEGSFFIVEHAAYPYYGLYILNRMGREDVLLPLNAEDEIHKMRDDFTGFKTWPEWTKRRLDTLGVGASELVDFDPRAKPNRELMENTPIEEKGEPAVYGFWWVPTGTREHFSDVLARVIECLKDHVPYPEQFRFGPERPPELKDASKPNSDIKVFTTSEDESSPPATSNAVDALFASLAAPPASSSTARLSPVPEHSEAAKSTPLTLDGLFASVSMPAVAQPERPASSTSSSHSSSSRSSSRALTQDVLESLMRGGPVIPSFTPSQANGSRRSSSSSSSQPPRTGMSIDADDESSGFSSDTGAWSIAQSIGDADATPKVNGDSRLPHAPPIASQRTLVPFSDDSALWPYNRANAVNGNNTAQPDEQEEGEIPEFDFNDVSLHSLTSGRPVTNGYHHHPSPSKSSKRKQKEKERETIEKSWDAPSPIRSVADGQATLLVTGSQFQIAERTPPQQTSETSPEALNPTLASQALLKALFNSGPEVSKKFTPKMEKKQFASEVMTLFYRDPTFVDKVWKGYYGDP
ncbi:hypothetical protein DL96DRAFT_1706973 [Flagelloscypha sp. PMI_526]|nr:hypothetical protein DL96DRAFT_1706973 [Flagelloscypha sp. PMI_526]